MTSNATSTVGQRRSRLRRNLGAAVVAAALATPLALAPAASAQTGGPLGGIENTLADTITSLPNTLTHPLGGSSGDGPPGNDACENPELISPLRTCVIDSVANLLGGQSATAKKATVKEKVRSVRKQTRVRTIRR